MRALVRAAVAAGFLVCGLAVVTQAAAAFDVAALMERTVKLSVPGSGSGSGVVIYSEQWPDGSVETYVMTNEHVARGAVNEGRGMLVMRRADSLELTDARVVATDRANDIALLRINWKWADQTAWPSACVSMIDALPLGTEVATVGFPDGVGPIFTTGHSSVIGYHHEYRGRSILTSVPVYGGNSGGGLFAIIEGQAQFVGMMFSQRLKTLPSREPGIGFMLPPVGEVAVPIPNISYAIPAWDMRKFLMKNDYGWLMDHCQSDEAVARLDREGAAD